MVTQIEGRIGEDARETADQKEKGEDARETDQKENGEKKKRQKPTGVLFSLHRENGPKSVHDPSLWWWRFLKKEVIDSVGLCFLVEALAGSPIYRNKKEAPKRLNSRERVL